MVKVSICIPAYNNQKGIKRLLDSIIIQTYKDFEIIITDDSSTEEIKILVEQYENGIKYFRNEKRLGATANWNESIKRSTGEFIKIMHHDDWFDDANSLQSYVDLLESNRSAVLAFSGSHQVSTNGIRGRCIRDDRAAELEKDYRKLFLGNWIGAPSAVIYRKSEKEFDENLTWLVDIEFYMNLLSENKKFIYTTKPLISIGISETQLTMECKDNSELNRYEFGYVFEKYQLYSEREYRKKLIQIFIENHSYYKQLKKYQIPYFEFMIEYLKSLIRRR